MARVQRTWPPDAGNAAISYIIGAPPELEAAVRDVMKIGCTGIFQLQFLDFGDDSYWVIDLEPRLFASLPLTVSSGANLSSIWSDHVLGREAAATDGARAGMRYRCKTQSSNISCVRRVAEV